MIEKQTNQEVVTVDKEHAQALSQIELMAGNILSFLEKSVLAQHETILELTQAIADQKSVIKNLTKGQTISFSPIDLTEVKKSCRCESCVPQGGLLHPENMRMILCATCGNKRCPHATNHRNACTSSNDIGQKGSSWEHVLPFGSGLKSPAPLPSVPSHVISAISAYGDARADDGDSAMALGNVIAGIRILLDTEKPVQTIPAASTPDSAYVDSTPGLHVGSSSFEAWYASHEKACSGDKQLARDAYSAGMGDPLVTYAQPAQQTEPIEPIFSDESRLSKYLAANYPGTPGATLTDRVIEALEEMDTALGWQSGVDSGLLSPRQRKYKPSAQPSHMDGVNTDRLTQALSWMGIASPWSQECYVSEMAFYVNALTSAIMEQKIVMEKAADFKIEDLKPIAPLSPPTLGGRCDVHLRAKPCQQCADGVARASINDFFAKIVITPPPAEAT